MRAFNTLTDYQVLNLARTELLRRLDRLQAKILKLGENNLPQKDKALYRLYSEQVAEINKAIERIQRQEEEPWGKKLTL